MKQHTSPCKECPWRRKAIRGWLANDPPGVWLVRAHGEFITPCHVHEKAQCAGMAIYRGNVGKHPRHPGIFVLPPNKQLVFTTPMEFEKHHTLDPNKPAPTPEDRLRYMEQAHQNATPV